MPKPPVEHLMILKTTSRSSGAETSGPGGAPMLRGFRVDFAPNLAARRPAQGTRVAHPTSRRRRAGEEPDDGKPARRVRRAVHV